MLAAHQPVFQFDGTAGNLEVVQRKLHAGGIILALRQRGESLDEIGKIVMIVVDTHDPELRLFQTNLAHHDSPLGQRGHIKIDEQALETDKGLLAFPFTDVQAVDLERQLIGVDADVADTDRAMQRCRELVQRQGFEHRRQDEKPGQRKQHDQRKRDQAKFFQSAARFWTHVFPLNTTSLSPAPGPTNKHKKPPPAHTA